RLGAVQRYDSVRKLGPWRAGVPSSARASPGPLIENRPYLRATVRPERGAKRPIGGCLTIGARSRQPATKFCRRGRPIKYNLRLRKVLIMRSFMLIFMRHAKNGKKF